MKNVHVYLCKRERVRERKRQRKRQREIEREIWRQRDILYRLTDGNCEDIMKEQRTERRRDGWTE
jgi:hypothetical protein